MSYVRKVISPNEKLILISRLSSIYVVEGIIAFAGLALIGQIADYYFYQYVSAHPEIRFDIDLWFVKFNEIYTPIPWAFSFLGFCIFWPLLLEYISTEVGLTNHRIIHKRGLFMTRIEQVELEDILAEHVTNGWLGWLLGYGRIRLECKFMDDVWLPAIPRPYNLVKKIHMCLMKITHLDYTKEMLRENLERIKHKEDEDKIPPQIRKLHKHINSRFKQAA